MGKMITFVAVLIFIDLFLLITGQLGLNSPTSILLGTIIDPSSILTGVFWTTFISLGGLAALVSVGGAIITLSAIVTRNDSIIFLGITLSGFALLIGDFITVFQVLFGASPVLAIVVMSPVIIIFGLIVVEWARGKD